MEKSAIILSGGMDSTTLLYYLLTKKKANNIIAISFNYGQRHKKELECAKILCQKMKVAHRIIDISSLNKVLVSALTTDSVEVPEGWYDESNMKQTVVPNRNMIMLSIATGVAISNGANTLYYGAHAGDHVIYPDCRPEFYQALAKAIEKCHFEPVYLKAPFINMTKADIVKLGLELNVPYKLTWSCYKGQERPCLKCGTCSERVEAFYKAGVKDPLLTSKEWQVALSIWKERLATKKEES